MPQRPLTLYRSSQGEIALYDTATDAGRVAILLHMARLGTPGRKVAGAREQLRHNLSLYRQAQHAVRNGWTFADRVTGWRAHVRSAVLRVRAAEAALIHDALRPLRRSVRREAA